MADLKHTYKHDHAFCKMQTGSFTSQTPRVNDPHEMRLVPFVAQALGVIALSTYLIIAHHVVAAAVPLLITTAVALVDIQSRQRPILMAIGVSMLLFIAVLLPSGYDLFAPATSYAFLIIATTLEKSKPLTSIATFASATAALIEGYMEIGSVALSLAAVSLCGTFFEYRSQHTRNSNSNRLVLDVVKIVGSLGLFPLIAALYYDRLATESDESVGLGLVLVTTAAVVLPLFLEN